MLVDGKLMMLTTNGAVIRIVDAYEGKPLYTLAGYQNNKVILLYCIVMTVLYINCITKYTNCTYIKCTAGYTYCT